MSLLIWNEKNIALYALKSSFKLKANTNFGVGVLTPVLQGVAHDLRGPKPVGPISKAHSTGGPRALTRPIPVVGLETRSQSGNLFSLPRVSFPIENPTDIADKQKAPDTTESKQALQVAALALGRIATPSDVEAPEEEPGETVPVPAPPTIRRSDIPSSVPQEFPVNWLVRLECLQKGLQDMQHQIGGTPEEERQGVPFTELVMVDDLQMNRRTPTVAEYDGTTDPVEHLALFVNAALLHRYTDGIKCHVFVTTFARAAQQWFNQLPARAIGSFQEFRSLFLHQFTSSRKLRKTELNLFTVRQKDNEPLKEYLHRFNTASLEVPSATQEVKASAFSQGLLDGDFFKSLAKKPVSKFDALLARADKYINMENAQAAKKESRGEKRMDTKEEIPSKKPRTNPGRGKLPTRG
ncbi:UNVERIFIED_CONTAM: hypothetical protein Sradi_1553000 [Sesamum radiatum]|uniref:Retrotransposon gag domain-containing protein n=1 Tax=Sesamum radiatum TaxID=300843 RepID=A0AAW2U9A4_SESRA